MLAVLECRQESLEVFLGEASLSNVIRAKPSHKVFHLLNADVAIFVRVDLLSQMSLQVLPSFKFVPNVPVDFQKLAFNIFKLIWRNSLRV